MTFDGRIEQRLTNTLIQIVPKVFNGTQTRAFGRPVINKCNFIHPEEIHSVPICMPCGIIILKKSDIGIILKQWDNVPRNNFITIALGIQIPFDNVRKPCAMPTQTKTEPPPQNDLVQVRNSRHNVHFSYGIFEPCHHLDEW